MSVYDKDLPSTEGIYHKFENDIKYRFRFASEPIVYVSSYKGKESTKYVWLAYNIDAKIAQLVKLPVTAARSVWDIARKEGDPLEYGLSITRTGSGFDTSYKVEASSKKSALSDEAEAACSKVDPIEMLQKGQGTVDVYWLSEAEDGGSQSRAESQPAPVTTAAPAPADDDEEEDW